MVGLNYFLVGAFILTFTLDVCSQSIITDRPDQTESAFTPGNNNFQIESGSIIYHSQESNEMVLNTSLFRYGFTDKFEFRLVQELLWDYKDQENLNNIGFSDLQLGLKYNITETFLESAILFHTIIPSGNAMYSDDGFAFVAKLILSGSISNRISAGLNIGTNIYDNSPSELSFTGVLGFSLTPKIGFFTEIYGTNSATELVLNYDHGFTYLVNPNLQFDISYGTGLNNDVNFISAGASWKIPGTK
jgi:hypothetical protein